MMGIIVMITQAKNKDFGEHEKVCHNCIQYYIKYGGNKYNFSIWRIIR